MASNPHPARYIGASNDNERPEDDFYPTPPEATWALLQAETFPQDLWEPACGDGAISKLASRHYWVASTDLYDHGFGMTGPEWDFFRQKQPPGDAFHTIRGIITNPPFRVRQRGQEIVVEDWIEHAWSMSQIQKMALFLKTTALGGVQRSHVLEKSNFARLLQFRNRVTLVRGGGHPVNTGMVDFGWCIFERGYVGPPTIHWIEEVDPWQPPLFASQE